MRRRCRALRGGAEPLHLQADQEERRHRLGQGHRQLVRRGRPLQQELGQTIQASFDGKSATRETRSTNGASSLPPRRFTQAIGHYTALAWSNTNRVGCGLTEYREGKWFSKLYTCDYGPSGNYIGGQMYREGRACSACPEGTSCSSQFRGLCGEGDAVY